MDSPRSSNGRSSARPWTNRNTLSSNSDRLRVDHRHAILRGKPQLAIARLHASRPIAAVRFHVQHAIAPAIRQGRNRIPRAGGELVQLPLTHPLDAAVAAHPKVAMRILENLKDAVIEQPFAHAIAGKLAVFEAAQAAVVGSDPDDAIAVLVDRPDAIAGQAIVFRPSGKLAIAKPRQASVPADPDAARRSLHNHADVIRRKAVLRVPSRS